MCATIQQLWSEAVWPLLSRPSFWEALLLFLVAVLSHRLEYALRLLLSMFRSGGAPPMLPVSNLPQPMDCPLRQGDCPLLDPTPLTVDHAGGGTLTTPPPSKN